MYRVHAGTSRLFGKDEGCLSQKNLTYWYSVVCIGVERYTDIIQGHELQWCMKIWAELIRISSVNVNLFLTVCQFILTVPDMELM